MPSNFALCICTYQRELLLRMLLEDVTKQTIQPKIVIIVDGDPDSGEVLNMLKEEKLPKYWGIVYVPSNHGNQTFQRYLGYRIAKNRDTKVLLYLDDDLRIANEKSIENIILPFTLPGFHTIAVTGRLIFPEIIKNNEDVTLDDFRTGINANSILVRVLGETRRYPPGSLTPSGKRVMYRENKSGYHKVEWLRGGAIAINMSHLSEKILSDDIFAMNHLRMGLCEDLVISRKLLTYGNLYLSEGGIFLHPSEDAPKAYSTKAFSFGYSTAYSRRWLNDYYRGFKRPKFGDRISLIRQYSVNSILNIYHALTTRKKEWFSFAHGYLAGVLKGLLKKPTAKNLTPDIDWWQDAEEALKQIIIIQ